ncbi:MAG: hypothetical protein KA175_13300 [Flavobacteriales bacterium]|nr:hypothetical protein [Flavobacteriales bacterium]
MRTIVLCLLIGLVGVCFAQQPGELDTTFANQGKLLVPCPLNNSGATTIDGNGRILVAVGRGSIDSLYLVRFHADGAIDSSFATAGHLSTPLNGLVLSVGQGPDDNIVVIGSEQSLLVDSVGAVINDHLIDAALDTLLQSTNWTVQDAQQDAHGLTVLVDTTGGSSFLVRFQADGSVDASFGSQGIVQLTSPLTLCYYPQRITLLGGKVGVLWMDSNCNPYPSGYDLQRVVYDVNGSFSEVYLDGGQVASADAFHANVFGTMMSQGQKWGTSWVDRLFFDHDATTTQTSLALDDLVDISLGPIGSDALGNFYVAGTNTVEDGWAIYRYTPSGVKDTMFDNDLGPVYGSWKYVQTNFFANHQAWPRNVLTQMDGKLLVSGTTSDGSQPYIVVARYHAIPDPRAKLDLKLSLGGPMDTNMGLMHDSLRAQGLVPLQQPYQDSAFQSVNGVGSGMTSTAVLNETGSDAVVDWVWLELLDAADTAAVVATRTGLLRRN